VAADAADGGPGSPRYSASTGEDLLSVVEVTLRALDPPIV
jgi:hypothetical protein